MRFPNLIWAIAQQRLAHYQAAIESGMSESRFSRCLSGRAEFSDKERDKIAALLGYPEDWLFQEPVPPMNRGAGDVRERLQPQPA